MKEQRPQRAVHVRAQNTREVVHTFTTDLTGSSYDRFLDGVYRKVDFDRFYVEEEPESTE